MNQAYLERVAIDLYERLKSVQLNEEDVQIISKVREGRKITILTQRAEGATQVRNIKVLDENGDVITERSSVLDVSQNRSLDFRFTFEVI
ncbi:hypothetical protein [Alkalihalobacillus trypoxylicola]|uniref:Uncharacterized protein n=1 Tax=Alkalihalobacillus trypoxylicola TaxID=519424 RepID=A0A162EWA2_9BACI|nr:hypothetical protein [Alkalihalobacillus trypoxylicola]KYG33886.1 hypothetical protein AZF04_15340 [Alkalihalobacillus trypoxylicola]